MSIFTSAKIVGAGIDPDVYRRQVPGVGRGNPAFVMSRGELMTFAQCPSRWLAGFQHPDSSSTDWGSLIDARALDAARFSQRYAVSPATYFADARKRGDPQIEKPWNRNATLCSDWEEAQQGKTVIKATEMEKSNAAIKVLREDPQIAAVLDESDHQVMCVAEYHDNETGLVVPLKILIDIVPDVRSDYAKLLFDLKTTTSADPSRWPRTAFEFGYHIQAAFYLDIYCAATGEDRVEFGHIVQESYPPFQTGKMVLSQEFLQLGREAYTSALRKYCLCLKENEWPGYPPAQMCLNSWNYVSPIAWMVQQSYYAPPQSANVFFRSETPT